MTIKKRRRLENKTDYNARKIMLKSNKPRIIFRKTNKYIIGQCAISKESQDYVVTGMFSKELENYGWPKSSSIKSIPACYLSGYLLGKKILDKEQKEGIFDIGLGRNIHKSKTYAFLKGVVDSGVKVNHKPETFPDEARLMGKHLKKSVSMLEIKSAIDKKFV